MSNRQNKSIEVSIIMPTYNSECYIVQSIESVREQTYKKWELIIIDDGSIDGTEEKVQEIMNQDNRVKFYRNEVNKGVAYTRNKGITLAKGEWIAFLDSDDVWDSYKLEKQMKHIEETKAEFVFTGSAYIDERGDSYTSMLQVPEKVNYKTLLKQNIISCSSVLIKKCHMENFEMQGTKLHEDYGCWLRVLRHIDYAYGMNEPLLIYRISRRSKSGNKIKSAGMNYRTYRFLGIGPIKSIYYMVWYTVNGIKKYRRIKGGG